MNTQANYTRVFYEFMFTASLAFLTRAYFKHAEKSKIASSHIWFNSTCLRNNIIPNYIRFKRTERDVRHLHSIHILKLKNEIKRWYAVRDENKLKTKIIYDILTSRLHNFELDDLNLKLHNHLHKLLTFRFSRLHSKLDRLLTQYSHRNPPSSPHFTPPDTVFHDRVLNLSKATFTESEIDTLKLGLGFSFPLSFNKIVARLITDTEFALRSNSFSDFPGIKTELFKALNRYIKNHVNKKVKNIADNFIPALNSIRRKANEHKLFFSRADKGHSLVVLEQSDYKSKVLDFLGSSNFSILDNSPVAAFTKSFKECLTLYGPVLFNNISKFIPMNSHPPRLYGLPKIHKDGVPIRPVVSFCGSLAYDLSKWLCKFLFDNTSHISPHSVRNSYHLVNKLRDLSLPEDCMLVSFDVSNLFTNVPVPQTLVLLKDLLCSSPLSDDICESVFRLTEVCLRQNFFTFDGQFYCLRDGLGMGNPLSPYLAELFMSFFERLVFNNSNPYRDKIFFWHRYVDDVISCWLGTPTELSDFLSWLNQLHININFTMEVESDRSIPFLDLRLTRLEDKVVFDIYRKPTQTDYTIGFLSNHHFGHKLSGLQFLVHRLHSIPLGEDNYTKELNTIYWLAHKNGFTRQHVNSLLRRYHRRRLISDASSLSPIDADRKYIKISYMGRISNILGSIFKKHGFNIAYKSENTLHNILVHNKDPVPLLNQSGVYRLECGSADCNAVYVGRTGRTLQQRIKEHLRSQKMPSCDKSVFGKHLRINNHPFDPVSNAKILHRVPFGTRQSILEEFEIFLHSNNEDLLTLNAQQTLVYPEIFNVVKHMLKPKPSPQGVVSD